MVTQDKVVWSVSFSILAIEYILIGQVEDKVASAVIGCYITNPDKLWYLALAKVRVERLLSP